MNPNISRRRFIGITAASVAVLTACKRSGSVQAEVEPVVWKGIALGAAAELRLYHSDRAFAQKLIAKAVAETERLEKLFSLYRDDSALTALNKNGFLNQPAADLLALLSLSREMHTATAGAFDPTIQPLWNAYAAYFSRYPDSENVPSAAIAAALKRVGMEKVGFNRRRITFAERGMALSFNGIAQGYITDRITDMLRQNGLERALADMGEIRAVNRSNRHFQAGIRDPRRDNAILLQLPLQNQALATSGGYETYLDQAGRFTHLFDPKTGDAAPRYQSVSVTAPTAAVADALSTAFAVSNMAQIRQTLAKLPDVQAWILDGGGNIRHLV